MPMESTMVRTATRMEFHKARPTPAKVAKNWREPKSKPGSPVLGKALTCCGEDRALTMSR
ncbi:hypothetical protein D3C71_1753700 [compost metagenome]